MALMFAKKAGLNQGIVTSLLATYCIFTTVIFYMLFKEKLQLKFILGIFLMLFCLVIFASSTGGSSPHPKGSKLHKKHETKLGYSLLCFCMALLAPLMISLFIAVSRFWTERFGYSGLDFTMDTYFVMGLAELPFFIHHATTLRYTQK